eukprot:TRINITY_DN14420_c0_g1_i1.p1 TRINITY_DN14420_c0_g1~~TRINITY_DN14420_c0_g1_i1.p1  ORF type:complete len:281 (+),score=60.72 TRINITY_DN14420_c0_g1_i1:43-843(+)
MNILLSICTLALCILFVAAIGPPDFDTTINFDEKDIKPPRWPDRWEAPHAFIREHHHHHNDRDEDHHDHHVKGRDLLSFGKIFYDLPLKKARVSYSNCPKIREHEFSEELNCDVVVDQDMIYVYVPKKHYCCKTKVEKLWEKMGTDWFEKLKPKYRGITEKFNTKVHHWESEKPHLACYVKSDIDHIPEASRGLVFAMDLKYIKDEHKNMTFLTDDSRKSKFLPEDIFEIEEICRGDKAKECRHGDEENMDYETVLFPFGIGLEKN